MSVDERCIELARYFFADVYGATAKDETALAEAIQDVCEAACTDVELREGPQPEAITEDDKP